MDKIQIRHLDDPSNTSGTLLTLPQSDFPRSKKSCSVLHSVEARNGSDANGGDDDRLVLVRLPSAKTGGVTMNDLTQGQTVYMLGDTSEHDIVHSSGANGQTPMDGDGLSKEGNIHVPTPLRLVVEGTVENGQTKKYEGKTLELMRVETSNTYILVPPLSIHIEAGKDLDHGSINKNDNGSNKRQKMENSDSSKKMTTMPARSVGLIPGEESPACFFLEPIHLKPGHYSSKLRWALSRWVYDPLDPPDDVKFGYSLSDLAHICRTSESEIGYALCHGVFGAENALAIPIRGESTSNFDVDERRYGSISEEGRQTVTMAILSALLESDVELEWNFSDEIKSEKGMDLSLLMKDVRTHWHNLEEDGVITSRQESQLNAPMLSDSKHTQNESQSQFFTPAEFNKMRSSHNHSVSLSDEVIWHCLRPIVCYTESGHKDNTPQTVWLVPDQVAKLAAHTVFLRGTSSDGWRENEFMEAWNMRMPSISKYQPSLNLLRGIALSDLKAGQEGENPHSTQKVLEYFPEAGLPLVPSLRIKSMFAMRCEWTLDEAIPYLEKIVSRGVEINGDKSSVVVESEVKSLLEKHAKATNSTGKNVSGDEVMTTKYVLL